jgi:DNA-binding response OmpR family regulator
VENHHNYGTGIGLYYSRRLLLLHHGEIHCENLKEGGVKFTVTLPANDIYAQDEHVVEPTIEQTQCYPIEETHSKSEKQKKGDEKIMLIDDDSGIISYLKILLSPYYNIVYTYEAETALDKIRTEMPDIVLSDVAMPVKDGFQLCKEIKEDPTTCHIPVVLVTAKTTKEYQITGLKIGADAYITKPFDPDYLYALIRSQLDNRKRIQRIVSEATKTEDIEENTLSEQDKKFMDELYALMERELSNTDLNVNLITKELLISRTKLYYKIKALTGEKPYDFFKKFKLNRAANLLKSGKYNVTEVAYMTGFSSLSVFSRNFKIQFGMTPLEYIKKIRKSND